MNDAPLPARGHYADGFEPLARRFARSLGDGEEIGAAVAVYHRGSLVVDLWGGLADRESRRPWTRDTRIVVFSATKGLAAMAFHILADRGLFRWGDRVARYWPGFARGGKDDVTVRTLLNHRAGLPFLDASLTLLDCTTDEGRARVLDALEAQTPAYPIGTTQAYHALTWGLYAAELFRRIADESLGKFLETELLEPVGSDARLGTPEAYDRDVATLYAPPPRERVRRMLSITLRQPWSTEGALFRSLFTRGSVTRRAFSNPASGRAGILPYNDVAARRAELASASATATARGLAAAYAPFSTGGTHHGRRFFSAESVEPLFTPQTWAHDPVLHKPVGWSQGFLKEETHLFSPEPSSFGHPGLGGALGWCDPRRQLAIGYVPNRMHWKVRSSRAIALCRALYECAPVS